MRCGCRDSPPLLSGCSTPEAAAFGSGGGGRGYWGCLDHEVSYLVPDQTDCRRRKYLIWGRRTETGRSGEQAPASQDRPLAGRSLNAKAAPPSSDHRSFLKAGHGLGFPGVRLLRASIPGSLSSQKGPRSKSIPLQPVWGLPRCCFLRLWHRSTPAPAPHALGPGNEPAPCSVMRPRCPRSSPCRWGENVASWGHSRGSLCRYTCDCCEIPPLPVSKPHVPPLCNLNLKA